jgi:hypothetical protein
MLWKVRIHMRQKLALGAIFSLVMITIAVAIIRFVVVSRNAQPEQSWLYFWNTIETTIGRHLLFFPPSARLQTLKLTIRSHSHNNRLPRLLPCPLHQDRETVQDPRKHQ